MKLKCEFCGKFFESTYKKRFCNRQCSAKFINSNQSRKELLSKKNKEYWKNNKDELSKRNKHIKESWTTKRKNEQSKAVSERYKNESYRQNISEKTKQRWENSEYREHMKSIIVQMWKNPDIRNAFIEKRKQVWKNKLYKDRMRKIHKESWTIERKNKFSALMIEKWRDNKWVEKRQSKTHGIYKNYQLPSGKIVKVQGYEPQALDNLLKEYDETDIVIGIKEINNHINKIEYKYKNKIRRYYPDFYIKSTNTIIEVKSPWTFKIHKERNLLKEPACLDNNYNFKFLIIG